MAFFDFPDPPVCSLVLQPAAADVSSEKFDSWRVVYGKFYDDAAVYAER